MRFLQSHPFPVLAYFDRVVAVSFAFPEAVLRPLMPDGLELDTYKGLGFVTAALVWTKHLRPAGFPAFLGRDFFLAGYRIFTRFEDASGKHRRGLKILRSETDKYGMVWTGNMLTKYHYRKVSTQIEEAESVVHVRTHRPDGNCTLDLTYETVPNDDELPPGSPFPDWKTARRYAGPMPYTFSDMPDGSFVVIKGTRQDWEPYPVRVKEWKIGLFEETPLRDTVPILANAFAVNDISYRWEKGEIVQPMKVA